jgi:tetratricopeptide (TPR) repeat protein
MLNDAGNRGVITSIEARTVIALFLRREARYKEAIQVVRGLKSQYPHDFLFCLEEANLRKDAGEGMAAVAAYREIVADAPGPATLPRRKLELAYFGLGDALRGQRHYGEAAQAYEQAAWTTECWPGTQDPFAAGRRRVPRHERRAPWRSSDYQMAIDAGPNTSRADTARKRLRTRRLSGVLELWRQAPERVRGLVFICSKPQPDAPADPSSARRSDRPGPSRRQRGISLKAWPKP